MSRRSPWFALLLSLSVALGLLGPTSLAAPRSQTTDPPATPSPTPVIQGTAGIQVEAALQAELAVGEEEAKRTLAREKQRDKSGAQRLTELARARKAD